MDFGLTPKQKELQERAREAVVRVVSPIAQAVAPGERLTGDQLRAIYKGLAPLGYVGSTIPESEGGAGLSYIDYGLLLEALAPSPVVLAEVVPPRTVYFLANPEQKQRWLSKLLAGDYISTACITEPQAGSDLRSLKTTAIDDGASLRVNGVKKWVKLGGIADLLTVLVVTDPAKGAAAGTSRVVVERSVSPWQNRELPSVGIRNLSYAEVEFNNLAVPRENLLGGEGGGTEAFYRGVEASRALVGLQAAGIAQAALDIAVRYAQQRKAFGKTLAQMQSIQTALVDASGEVDAARLLCLRALWTLDQGQRCPREASMAKVFATEAAVRVCQVAMGTMGAFGLSEEARVEQHWRDAIMLTAIDGASGIQRLVVGRELLGKPAFV